MWRLRSSLGDWVLPLLGPSGPIGSARSRLQPQTCQAAGGDGALTIPKACLIIKTHTSRSEANTRRGGIGTLQRGLDPSPSKSGTSARESNTSPLDSMGSQSA